ncbi:hypothetical protein SERLA73DRAFT_68687 [Serpula lacrymans var. lacrymans S7.3]|uniref:Uncharacterized protein n=1 Tax=Serpula lacrymans var. lacrymans (strain S7.3) TaxID=936435 RepID=F8PHP3_SERL3|nr:hypothetical protein SERLA73DRAFT_68687 [Serpula lacrymans var. lacrymans S7.3]
MSLQAKVPPAVCMLHNFIKAHDPSDIDTPNLLNPTPEVDNGELSHTPPMEASSTAANNCRDWITCTMWIDYQQELEFIPIPSTQTKC